MHRETAPAPSPPQWGGEGRGEVGNTPAATAQPGTQEPSPDPMEPAPPPPDPAAPDPRLREDNDRDASSARKHPMHREPRTPPPAPDPEPYFDWRNKTVLERFAHFFPERLAAYHGDAAAAHAAWAAENEAEWARVRAERASASKPHAQ